MTRDEADALIDSYIVELHEIMGKIEALATEHDIAVSHPFKEYGEQGNQTFHTIKTFSEDASFEHVREYAEDEGEDLETYCERSWGITFPDWISSYGFE